METVKIVQAHTDTEIQAIASLAEVIWNEHFTDIIGEEQVHYMVDRFQSFPALKGQIEEGYEYYMIYSGHSLAGYCGIHIDDNALFLSKLYINKPFRGLHLSTLAFQFLKDLSRNQGLTKIWLTCNKNNSHTLAVYDHWGFCMTREQKADIGNGFFMDDYILEYPI